MCDVRNAFVHLRYWSDVFLSTTPYPHLKVKIIGLEICSFYKISFLNESFDQQYLIFPRFIPNQLTSRKSILSDT